MSVASATALHDVRTVAGQADRRPAASKIEFWRVHTDGDALLVSHGRLAGSLTAVQATRSPPRCITAAACAAKLRCKATVRRGTALLAEAPHAAL